MSWGRADVPSQAGRVAAVTGANGGLGLETALALAGAGAHVVLLARDPARAERAEERIRAQVPGASLELVRLDLGALASARAAADAVLAGHERLDLLVLNAGIMAVPEGRTEDGFERQLGVNHLGHWALTAHLLPALLRAPAARVVSVTSTARHLGRPLDPDDPHLRRGYEPWRAYGQSKLANAHFALGLERRFRSAGARAQALLAHPGLAATELQVRSAAESGGGASQRFFEGLAARTGMSPADGALPQLRAATDPGARGGELYAPRWGSWGPPVRRPVLGRERLVAAVDRLWEVSARETGVPLEVPAAP